MVITRAPVIKRSVAGRETTIKSGMHIRFNNNNLSARLARSIVLKLPPSPHVGGHTRSYMSCSRSREKRPYQGLAGRPLHKGLVCPLPSTEGSTSTLSLSTIILEVRGAHDSSKPVPLCTRCNHLTSARPAPVVRLAVPDGGTARFCFKASSIANV
jgi:hypothetical protein